MVRLRGQISFQRILLVTHQVFLRSFPAAEGSGQTVGGDAVHPSQALLSGTTGYFLRLKVALTARTTSLGQSVQMAVRYGGE